MGYISEDEYKILSDYAPRIKMMLYKLIECDRLTLTVDRHDKEKRLRFPSNIEHRTSNIGATNNEQANRTTNSEQRTTNIRHRTSNIEHLNNGQSDNEQRTADSRQI
jgi:hypothetical protein